MINPTYVETHVTTDAIATGLSAEYAILNTAIDAFVASDKLRNGIITDEQTMAIALKAIFTARIAELDALTFT